MLCLLLSGFKGTGKDTLYNKLSSKKVTSTGTCKNHTEYKCYKSPENKVEWSSLIKNVFPAKRLSFADPLKADASKNVMKIRPDLTPSILEANKNKSLKDIPVISSAGKKYSKDCKDTKNNKCDKCFQELSYRDHLIEEAYSKRREDIDYWCKRALQDIKHYHGNVVVTDYRYPNEKDFMQKIYQVRTVWIYRSGVEIPHPNILSEWELHSEKMDYLLTDDFEAAVKLRPQYKDYILSS